MDMWLRLVIAIVLAVILLYSVARVMYRAGQVAAYKKVLRMIEESMPPEALKAAKEQLLARYTNAKKD